MAEGLQIKKHCNNNNNNNTTTVATTRGRRTTTNRDIAMDSGNNGISENNHNNDIVVKNHRVGFLFTKFSFPGCRTQNLEDTRIFQQNQPISSIRVYLKTDGRIMQNL